jgi:hypothetical protein
MIVNVKQLAILMVKNYWTNFAHGLVRNIGRIHIRNEMRGGLKKLTILNKI